VEQAPLRRCRVRPVQQASELVGEVEEEIVYAADGFLKEHGVESLLTSEDLAEQKAALDTLSGK